MLRARYQNLRKTARGKEVEMFVAEVADYA
jgi:hypothetical protein